MGYRLGMETTKTQKLSIETHSAHYGMGFGVAAGDIITLDFVGDWRPGHALPKEAAERGMEYHCGSRGADGIQHWYFIRSVRSAVGSTCERCKEVK